MGRTDTEAPVFAKLVFTVVALAACCCVLLAMRQLRIQAAGEMARVQSKVRQQDEELWTLRAKIAERVAPESVTLMARDIGPLHPLRPEGPALASAQPPAVQESPAAAEKRQVVVAPPAPETVKARKQPGRTTRKPLLPGKLSDSRVAVHPHGGQR